MIIIIEFLKVKRRKFIIGFMLLTIIITSTVFVGFARKNITVVVDGNPIKLVTYQKTFDQALKKANISIALKDKLDKALDSKIVNNDIITINRAVSLNVLVDNKELNITSSEKDVAQMLITEKIVLSPNDKILPSLKTNITKGMDVIITRVKTETLEEKQAIDFKTVITNDNAVLKSKKSITQNGVKGEKSISIDVTYENGKEVSRKVVKETIVKNPINKIIVQGTMSPKTISRGDISEKSTEVVNVSVTNTSGKTLNVKATAYWAFNGVNNTYTASGRKAVRNPNGYSTIAVDTKVIPLGTKLYVEGYGNAIAADKGSSVKGNYIDVYFNTRQEAINWGVKYLKVTILD
ncbi:3D domain-containing protein [Clostridium sp.]|uniref:3D domain-containing protein n=1 Tax=Clostridium sp. TaxID=1506 RepID=UPI001A398EB9|nr:3D domain-containing protein [Clostridium sp.]MBK5241459.1 G5 domain-containing protein [Clostridium sp.]